MKTESPRGKSELAPAPAPAPEESAPNDVAPLPTLGNGAGDTRSMEPAQQRGPQAARTEAEATKAVSLRPPGATRRSLPDLLPFLPSLSLDERLGRLLLSMVLALLLWFYVLNLENPPEITVFNEMPIEVRNMRQDLRVVETLPTVNVTVQAPQNIMGTLTRADVTPYIDLAGLDEGVHQVPIHTDAAPELERQLIEVSVRPPQVQVQLEVQVTRVFSVSAEIRGAPATGYGLQPTQIDPAQVEVTGSQSAVARIAQVVVPVDVGGKAVTQNASVAPVALDTQGERVENITFQPQNVQVVVPVQLLFNSKPLPVRVPVIGAPAPGFRVSDISPDPTNVIVCCDPELLQPLNEIETSPVFITGTTSTVVTTTELLLPPGVTLFSDQSSTVRVRVSVEALVTTLQVSVAPSVDGLTPGLSAVVSPDQIDLTLAGTFTQLQGLRPSDVSAAVDVSGLDPGTYELVPRLVLPQGIKLESSSAQRVTVTIIAPTPVPPSPSPVPPSPTRAVPTLTPTVPVSPTGQPITGTVTLPPSTGSPVPTTEPQETPTP